MPHVTGHPDELGHHEPVAETFSERVDVVGEGRRWYEFDLAGRINTMLFAILAGLETLLALRFTLFAFGANPSSGFVDFIYDFSGFFVEPFENAFANRTWDEGIIEVNTLLAMGVYALIFAVIAMLVAALVPRIGGYHHDGGDVYRSTRVTHGGGTR
jgi:hypothetical protein